MHDKDETKTIYVRDYKFFLPISFYKTPQRNEAKGISDEY
jgi:hypothetical protein